MDLEYSTMSSEHSSDSSDISQESTRLEECQIEGMRIQLPQGLCENKYIFKEFFSSCTWHEHLSEQQRQHLKTFLPEFPENSDEEKEETIRRIFARENMRFGSPLTDFQSKLKNGYYRPDIVKMRSLMKKAQIQEYKYRQRQYYFCLMKEILLSRQQLLETAFNQPPGMFPKMERIPNHPPPRTSPAEQRTKRRYFQELAAVRQEVGESDHSSEDENYPEGPPPKMSKKQKRQLAALECSLSPDMNHVISTLALKPSGFDLESNITSNYNPYEMNEDLYKVLLMNHKRRRMECDDHPELNILGITTQDISNRAQIGKRPIINRIPSGGYDPKVSSKKKSKGDNRATPTMVPSHISQMKHSPQTVGGYSSNGSDMIDSEEDEGTLDHSLDDMERVDVEGEVESPISASKASPSAGIRTPVTASRNRSTNNSGSSPRTSRTGTSNVGGRSLLQRHIKTEVEEESNDLYPDFNISPNENVYQPHSNNVTSSGYSAKHMTAATLSDLDGIDMMNIPVELADTAPDAMQINIDIKPAPELMQDTHACFFSLIRDVICSTPDHRMALLTLEDRLKAWQENPISPLNDWYSLADSWLVMLTSAITFLSGDFPDAQPEDFVPYVEYKPNIQAYQWIGAGRDSDSHLQPLCQHWLEHRDEMTTRPIKEEEVEEEGDGGGEERVVSPPPPRCPTTWVVHPSTPEEKECFRDQERLRYENPHRAFTYRMHNYESVVGPVKGVYNQSIGMNKPRGHSLLVADRPNFVTILALVRDATARLPNGEGTRTDICELLKDSQYLAPVSQESYLHSVVSGALDRLHYETDPCVRYDTKRKIWIYLHRGRTEEEFERLHQQQQGMAKTKKSSSQRKASRSKQQKDAAAAAAAAAAKESASPMITSTATITMTTTTTTETTQLSVASTESLTSVATVHSSPVQAGLPVHTSSAPVISTSIRPSAARNPRMPMIQRTYTLAPGQTVQNLQVSTPPGLQTIQVSTAAQSVLAGKSLLTTVVTQQQQQLKTVAVTSQANTQVSTNSATPVLKTVTLTPQQMQAMNAARGLTVASLRDASSGVAVRMPTSSLVGTIASSSPATTTEVTSAVTTVVTSSCGIPHQKMPLTSRATVQTSLSSPKTLVNVTSPQMVNMSQVQLVGSKSPQSVGSPKPVLAATGKTLVSAGLSGVKLVNAMKADGTQQQTIFIKQSQTDQQPQTVIGTVQQQPQLLQHSNKQAAAITQLQQQLKQQLQQKQQQQQQQQQQQAVTAGVSTATTSAQRVVTTMSVLSPAQCQARVMARVGGKPIPVTHMAVQQQQQAGGAASGGTTVVKPQQPMVAKVLTSTQGQVISMESLVAHQKQHGTLPQGTALRVTAGGKPGQASLIQIPSSTQFAVVSQGNLLSVGQSRVLQAQLPSQQVHSSTSGIQQQAVTIQQQAQTQATKLVTAAGKPLTGATATTATANLRMLGPASGGLTMTQIGGKPVLVASKTPTTPIQGGVGQNVILTSQAAGGHQTVVLASQALRAQGGTLLLQQGGTQQILLPPGFQGGTLNIKTLQGLQGLKVIPLSQATAASGNKGRQQVYARIITPGMRPAAASIVHQNTSTATSLQTSSTDVTTANTQLGNTSTDQ